MTFDADEYFKPGTVLCLGGFEIRTVSVPGHTIGSVCYYFEKEGILFSGDTLFSGSVGRSDFPTGNAGLMSLDDDVTVFPGHGESTSIGYEREHNPFL